MTHVCAREMDVARERIERMPRDTLSLTDNYTVGTHEYTQTEIHRSTYTHSHTHTHTYTLTGMHGRTV